MTDSSGDPPADADASARDGYDQLADAVDSAIAEALEKVESGRVYDAENEKVRIQWIRALTYAASERRKIENDRHLSDLAERVERLEEARENGTVAAPVGVEQ